MKAQTFKITLTNGDNAKRVYDIKATFGLSAISGANLIESGEVCESTTLTTLATFASYGENQLAPTFYTSEGRSDILAAIEEFIASGLEVVNANAISLNLNA